jgi:hypothetical protein
MLVALLPIASDAAIVTRPQLQIMKFLAQILL